MLKHISALVTGGASGLGRATAERLVKNGASVTILDLPTSDGKNVASQLGDKALFTPGDVTSENDVKESVSAMLDQFQQINTLVNCAGIGLNRKILDLQTNKPHPLQEFQHTLEVNTLGTFNVIRLAAVHMMNATADDDDGQRGVVINTSGIAAYDGHMGQVAFAASQGAITSMTLPLARDFGTMGIRCVTIAPGLFDTAYFKGNEKFAEIAATGTLPKRLGRPDEFAHLVEHVILNKMINGCVIRIDACLRMHV